MREYHLFISHSWSHSDAYDSLVKLLRAKSYFEFSNYSVPRDDPIHRAGTDAALRRAIRGKMTTCNVVLILAGVYATYSKWIDERNRPRKAKFWLSKAHHCGRTSGK